MTEYHSLIHCTLKWRHLMLRQCFIHNHYGIHQYDHSSIWPIVISISFLNWVYSGKWCKALIRFYYLYSYYWKVTFNASATTWMISASAHVLWIDILFRYLSHEFSVLLSINLSGLSVINWTPAVRIPIWWLLLPFSVNLLWSIVNPWIWLAILSFSIGW